MLRIEKNGGRRCCAMPKSATISDAMKGRTNLTIDEEHYDRSRRKADRNFAMKNEGATSLDI